MLKKRFNKKEIIGCSVCLLTLIILVALMIKGKNPTPQYFTVSIDENNSTYQTKLDAYKAKDKEESKKTYYLNSSAYENEAIKADDFMKEDNDDENIVTEIKVSQQLKTPTNHAAPGPANNISSQNEVKSISANISSMTKIDDEAYEQVKNDIQNYYNSNPPEDQDNLTKKEQRKKEMEASWSKLGSGTSGKPGTADSFRAVIHGTQTVKRGQPLKLRLTEESVINGEKIPKNTIIAGIVSINENRLNVRINSVNVANKIIPARLDVYGSDGIAGIPIDVDITSKTATGGIADEAISQTTNVIRQTGAVGQAVSGIANTVARTSKRERDAEITLLDNQAVIIKQQ